MAMAELWFGKAMERKYLITMTLEGISLISIDQLRDPIYWSDIDRASQSTLSWKQLSLPDMENVFQVALVRSGTPSDPVSTAF